MEKEAEKGVIVIDNPNSRENVEEGEKYFKERVCSAQIFDGWTLYDQPVFNSMKPDFILTHPEKGIIIVEVKDYHLNPPAYKSIGLVLGTDGKYKSRNPISQVQIYREELMKYEIKEFLYADEKLENQAYGIINTVIYFHKASREQAVSFCGAHNYILFWSKHELDYLCTNLQPKPNNQYYPRCLFHQKSKFAREPERILQKIVGDLEGILRPSDYARERIQPIELTPEQKRLVRQSEGSVRRWGGVAGSGKSLVLASKASEAIKNGERVLILTFNITLRHYLRDLCSQQHGLEDRGLLRSNLTISHFHGFLKILLAELKISSPELNLEDYTDNMMIRISEEIQEYLPDHLRYDSILIDEGQDFTGEWIIFLKQFYTEKGELFIFYDQAQDLYNQSTWITDPLQIKGIGFKGQPGHLKISHRLPQAIVFQVEKLRNIFNIRSQEPIQPSTSQQDLFTRIYWINSSLKDRLIIIEKYITSILTDKTSNIEDITILTMKEATGIEVVQFIEGETNFKTSHVYDLTGEKNYKKRRNEKWRFQPGKGRLKVSSYHSFKGWESSHIILLLECIGDESVMRKEKQDALFIAMTRVNSFSDSRSFLCINSCMPFNWLKTYFE